MLGKNITKRLGRGLFANTFEAIDQCTDVRPEETSPESERCDGQGTLSASCHYNYHQNDRFENTCLSMGGYFWTYSKLNITCRSRNNQREDGRRLTDHLYYTNVPECFDTENCGKDEFSDLCSDYAGWAAEFWEQEYLKDGNYYSVSCTAQYEGCSARSARLSNVAIIGIPLGATSVLLALLAQSLRRRCNVKNQEKDQEVELDLGDSDIRPTGIGAERVNGDEEDHIHDKSAATGDDEDHIQADTKEDKAGETDSGENCGSPLASFGALQGWIRDRHLKHTVLWLGNIIFVTFWIYYSIKGCEEQRWSGGCKTESKAWFWIEMRGLVVFLCLFIYCLFLTEFYFSSTHKYLRNIETTISLADYMQQIYRTEPTLSLTIECYHMETRVVRYTDSNGNSSTRTESYPVVTYVETEVVHIVAWKDISVPLNPQGIEQYQVTKVVLSNTFAGDSNYDRQQSDFVNRNKNRDVHYNLNIDYRVKGFKDRLLSYVDLACKPAFLTLTCCWIAHATLLPALPFRIWMSSITGKVEANVHKAIVTSSQPSRNDNERE